MKPLIFSLFDNEKLIETIKEHCGYEIGNLTFHQFPDEESYIKINSDVKNRSVLLLASLDHPNIKTLPLLFAAQTVKELGAKEVGLVAPYLAYMRQDKQFNSGEGITSKYFAAFLSQHFDWLVTIDPHLHRKKSLSELYNISATVLHASVPIASWLKTNIENPLIIGPDKESEQWVSDIAQQVGAPFVVLKKLRKGDRSVEITFPLLNQYHDLTPVLIDDIISTGKTMLETIIHLKNAKTKPPICIGIHGIFAENAYEELLAAGATKVNTCNTIKHVSNAIDVSSLITNFLNKRVKK